MKFRTGVVVGAAVGYYLGARAGRQRYEQMNRWVTKATRSAPVQSATTMAKQAVGLVDRPDDVTNEWVTPLRPEVG